MTTTKKGSRQLRLTTPVNALEKQRAERIARDEGYNSVAELVRELLAFRHNARLKKLAEKKRRNASKGVKKANKSSARLTKNTLPLRKSATAIKPSRSTSAGKRSSSRSTRSTTKNPHKRRIVAAGSKPRSTTRNPTKTGTTKNSSPILR